MNVQLVGLFKIPKEKIRNIASKVMHIGLYFLL